MLTITKEMITQWDWRFPNDMKEIALVIADPMEIGTEQVCSYFNSLGRTPIVVLVDNRETDWKEIYNYHVIEHIPITCSGFDASGAVGPQVTAW